MQFLKLASALAAATLASANTVTFKSLDNVGRTVHFTPNAGGNDIEHITVPGGGSKKVEFPQGWVGNFYAVSDGQSNTAGMLGEVAFNGWNGITFFDVSAIVNPNDHVGVKQMYPASSSTPISGCEVFPCNNAYYLPDDVQTKTTTETDLICTLGGGSSSKRSEEVDSPVFKRDFVLGRWAK